MSSSVTERNSFNQIATFQYVSKRKRIIGIIVGSLIFLMLIPAVIFDFTECSPNILCIWGIALVFAVCIFIWNEATNVEYCIKVNENKIVYKDSDNTEIHVPLPCKIVQTEKTIMLVYKGRRKIIIMGDTVYEEEETDHELGFDIIDTDCKSGKTIVEFLREVNK